MLRTLGVATGVLGLEVRKVLVNEFHKDRRFYLQWIVQPKERPVNHANDRLERTRDRNYHTPKIALLTWKR